MTPEYLRDALLPWAAPLRGPKRGDWLSEEIEEGQSLTEFRAVSKPRDIEGAKLIQIYRIDGSDKRIKCLPDNVVEQVIDILNACFPGVEFAFPDPSEELHDASPTMRPTKEDRPQLWDSFLIEWAWKLLNLSPEPVFAVTFLTETDLYHRELDDWVFGYADREKGGCCVSWNRCKLDGEDFSRSRCFLSLLLDELCHVFYMQHCVSFDCLMNGVNDEDELALQSLHLCPECHAKLFELLTFDPFDRLASLRKIFEELGWKRDASLAANLLARLKEADTR